MNRLTIVLIAAAVLVVGAAATIVISLRSGDATAGPDARQAVTPSDAEKRGRAERLFGGDPDRDVRGGQEMKPRW
ncbi:hypothetical protein AU467_30525 [Mesorhizobium loti]|uniref:Type IV conjugative transfer protein TrbJ/K C-terminal domain-containing protein n=1 Tax=Rhizobium loti TaxID=381 RepID=A0A124GFQ7_RHILI|nr:hypothetical protein AU467_30525 [Mesorhizobium loti]